MSHGKSNNPIFHQSEFLTQGYYEIKNDVVVIIFQKGEQFEVKEEWILIQRGQIMNDNGRIYDFTEWTK